MMHIILANMGSHQFHSVYKKIILTAHKHIKSDMSYNTQTYKISLVKYRIIPIAHKHLKAVFSWSSCNSQSQPDDSIF